MTIQVGQLPLGLIQTNCYIVGDTETKDAVIIDPAAQADRILENVKLREYNVREILATHTHFDHVIASYAVKQATGAPFRIHEEGLEQLKSMPKHAATLGIPVHDPTAEPDFFIQHGDIIEAGSIRLEARYTPGHSPGHLMFVMDTERLAFVGDCVFFNGIGRTDLPGADLMTLKKSIEEEIMTLPDDYTLCPGHGPVTTVERERAENPFIAQLRQLSG